MPRGRPTKSQIRQNIIEILFFLGEGYGYKIAKIYNEIFPPVTQRSVYYHLKKGAQLNEFELHEVREEKGQYSWGDSVEKMYYTLGKDATPRGSPRVKKYIAKWQPQKKIQKKQTQLPSKNVFTRFAAKFRKVK